MVQALPKHIISVIERRWQRRLDTQPQLKSGNNDDCSAEQCLPCDAPEAPESIEPVTPENGVAHRDHAYLGRGHT